ncbi:MAG: toll/interleukin-1 receptor domain-containing protein [Gammaproteobacteria bacterium]|nr:toll/interleukin-1 receptor domain-containing protein [Gammaproteobacteria bacterium]
MNTSETRVFISYSRADQELVTPIVKLMRTIGKSAFQDIDSIPAGKKWRTIIEESIEGASIVFVFWCAHSKCSDEVRKEWQHAIRMNKDVVPTLLDDTPLEPMLAEYQTIDFRFVTVHPGENAPAGSNQPDDNEEPMRRHRFGNDIQHNNHRKAMDDRIITTAAKHLLMIARERAVVPGRPHIN